MLREFSFGFYANSGRHNGNNNANTDGFADADTRAA
jgi:hypothetical protein